MAHELISLHSEECGSETANAFSLSGESPAADYGDTGLEAAERRAALLAHVRALSEACCRLQEGWQRLALECPAAARCAAAPPGPPGPTSPESARHPTGAESVPSPGSSDFGFAEAWAAAGSDEAKRALACRLWRSLVPARLAAPSEVLSDRDLRALVGGPEADMQGDGAFGLLTGEEQCYLRDAAAANPEREGTTPAGLAVSSAALGRSGLQARPPASKPGAPAPLSTLAAQMGLQHCSSGLLQPSGSRRGSLLDGEIPVRQPSARSWGRQGSVHSRDGLVSKLSAYNLWTPGALGERRDSQHSRAQSAAAGGETLDVSQLSLPRHDIKETSRMEKGEDMDGNKTINQYSVIDELGRGSYAKVKLVVHNDTNEPFALKILKKSLLARAAKIGSTCALAQAKVEIAIMKKLSHPRVIRLHEVIDDPTADKMYLIMDYVPGGQLLTMEPDGSCEPLPRDKVVRYSRDIASGLRYLHRHHIVHRDIKPANILIDAQDSCVLCDFGVSAFMQKDGDDVIEGLEGTPYFLSPELCRGEEAVHGIVADVWALGVTIYVMLFGRVCFSGSDQYEIMDAIQNKSLVVPEEADGVTVDLFRRILNKDPRRRMTLRELKQHPFITDGERPRRGSGTGDYDEIQLKPSDIIGATVLGSNVTPTTRSRGPQHSLSLLSPPGARQGQRPPPSSSPRQDGCSVTGQHADPAAEDINSPASAAEFKRTQPMARNLPGFGD
eukprot:TRINITY_DN26550_c0_g2_i1.p1 TRINITY_DN26550_c0_g2~~TRINITY_DN26550_c0_g2_i1.p1  ORF type:complete len:726 (+),score=145.16 TRINITY_DN26550_c0_g2_i1:102-2279(+)